MAGRKYSLPSIYGPTFHTSCELLWGGKAHINIRSHIKKILGTDGTEKLPSFTGTPLLFDSERRLLSHVFRPRQLPRESFAGYKLGQNTISSENERLSLFTLDQHEGKTLNYFNASS